MNCPPRHTFRTVFPVLALCWPAVFFDGMDVNWRTHRRKPHRMAGPAPDTGGERVVALRLDDPRRGLGCRPARGGPVRRRSRPRRAHAAVSGDGDGVRAASQGRPHHRPSHDVLTTSGHGGHRSRPEPGSGCGRRRVFRARVLPAVIAVPLLLKLPPESPGVLLERGEREKAVAVADRYGIVRPTPVAAAASGAAARLAEVRALFHPRSRWRPPAVAGLLQRPAARARREHLAAADDRDGQRRRDPGGRPRADRPGRTDHATASRDTDLADRRLPCGAEPGRQVLLRRAEYGPTHTRG